MYPRFRLPSHLVTLACLLGGTAFATPAAATACLAGATPTSNLGMPSTVTLLRSYHAGFATPARLAVDAADNVLVADEGRGEVIVRAENGAVSTRFAGLARPVSVAAGGGLYYIGDAATGAVRAYTYNNNNNPAWQFQFHFGTGDGEFGHPGDIAHDAATGEVFVSDTDRHWIGVYDGATGTFLRRLGSQGSGDGQFNTPTGIALYRDVALNRDELLVSDQMNYRMEAIDKTTGAFLYCLGTYNTTPSSEPFPPTPGGSYSRTYGVTQGLWVDATGRLFLADAFQGLVKVIDRSNGALFGSIGGFGQGPGELRVPADLAIDANGRLFVASVDNARLEVWGLASFTDPETVVPASVTLVPPTIDRNASPPTVGVLLEIHGHAPSGVTGALVNGLAPLASTVGDADLNGHPDLLLDVGSSALIATLGGASSGPVVVTGNVDNLGFSAQATLIVTAAPQPTTTNLAASPDPATAGAPVTLTASVAGLSPTGQVTFRNGSTVLCAAVSLASAQADCVVGLPAGFHSLTAEYGGDADDAGGTSAPLDLSVSPAAPTLQLSSSDPTAGVGETVTFTVTVQGVSPVGYIRFLADGTPLCEGVELAPSGPGTATAGCSTAALGAATHAITALYLGDASNTGADSPAFSQQVLSGALASVSAASPTGTGTITAAIAGDCAFADSSFLTVAQAGVSTPSGVRMPHGLFEFTTTNDCGSGATVTLTITYPQVLPPGTRYWKYGPSPGHAQPHWYVMPATIIGNTVTFSITDGGLGDDDLAANGQIVDQGGAGVDNPEIPLLGPGALLLLTLLLVSAAWAAGRKPERGT